MTYIIEGTLILEEKPEKYLYKFVGLKNSEQIVYSEGVRTKVFNRTKIVTSFEGLEHLANRGYLTGRVDDLETAASLCEQRKVDISRTKFFTPSIGWEEYLTRKFGGTEDERTIQGELLLWSESRIPTPWLYVFSSGTLENIFVFNNGRFNADASVVEKNGTKTTVGLALDISIFRSEATRTTKKTNIRNIYHRDL